MTFLVTLPFQTNPDNFDQITVTWDNPSLGVIPFTAYNEGKDTYVTQIYLAALAGDYGPVLSYASTHYYSVIDNNIFEGRVYNLGDTMVSPTGVQPANSITQAPPANPSVEPPYAILYYDTDWFYSYTDITTPLPEAKTNLINETNTGSAAAVVVQLSGYSPVQQATAPDITLLNTLDYPGVDIGTYQDYVDAVANAEIATINSATSISDLYLINPAALPFTPESGSSGVINIGRGRFGGPLDLNASNYVTFNSVSMTEAETELYAPATSSVVPYQGFPPDDFNSSGAIFTLGNYLIQIRETATSRVIAEFEVPLSSDGTNEDVVFEV